MKVKVSCSMPMVDVTKVSGKKMSVSNVAMNVTQRIIPMWANSYKGKLMGMEYTVGLLLASSMMANGNMDNAKVKVCIEESHLNLYMLVSGKLERLKVLGLILGQMVINRIQL